VAKLQIFIHSPDSKKKRRYRKYWGSIAGGILISIASSGEIYKNGFYLFPLVKQPISFIIQLLTHTTFKFSIHYL